MIIELQPIDKTAHNSDMAQFQAVRMNAQFVERFACQMKDFGISRYGLTAKQFHSELGMLTIAASTWRFIAENWSRILETQWQRVLLVMIEIKPADRCRKLWTQAKIAMM